MPTRVSNGADSFGTALRTLRVAAGLTQEELAERAGLTPHGVSSLERGRRTRPYPHTVRALARALELDDAATAALFATLPRRTPVQPTVPASPDGDEPSPSEDDPSASSRLLAPRTRLHGRVAELDRLLGLVRGGDRLITVVGAGGVGKTRLAVAVAERLAPDFVDGSVQVPLAHTTDLRQLLGAVADVLGIPDADAVRDVEPLVEHLADRRVLLVLDNVEQVPDVGPQLSAVVNSCPGVVVLVTSRVALRVRDETVLRLEPLAVPVAHPADLEEVASAPAGAMFLDRARSAADHLPLVDSDAPTVAEICRRLAGIPLALELSAAQLAVLGPDELLARLDQALRQPGATDLPERQRTLHATLEWSRSLLTGAEQRLLSRVAVFRGGFTLAGAEAVDDTEVDTWTTLRRLVEQSLVHVTRTTEGGTRYQLLEPVSEYATSLLDRDELAKARDAHAAYFLQLAEESAPEYTGSRQLQCLARLDAEEANLLAALGWTLGEGADPVTAGRLGWALWLFWWLRGRARTARELLDQVLTHELPELVAANAWLAHASMTFATGDLPTSARGWGEAHRLATAADDPTVAATALAGSGIVALASGDLASAQAALEEALDGFEGPADWRGAWMTGLCEIWLGTVLHHRGDRDGADRHLRRGLTVARGRGDRLTTYIALFNLAQVAAADSDQPAARRALEEAAELSVEIRDLANLAYVLEALAVLAAREDDLRRVPLLVGAAEALRESADSTVYGYYVPDAQQLAAAVERARSELGTDTYDDVVDEGRGLSYEEAAAVALGH